MSNPWKVFFIPHEIALEEILNRLESEKYSIQSILPSIFSTGQSPTFIVVAKMETKVLVNQVNLTAEEIRTEPIVNSWMGESVINPDILKEIKKGI